MIPIGKVRVLLVIASLAPSVFVSAAETAGTFSNDVSKYVRSNADNHYNARVTRAVRFRAAGDLTAALKNFSAAAVADIAEYPNYELWADMADLYCKTGRTQEGLALINEYKCAVEVLSGTKACWMNDEDSLEIPSHNILPLCYSRVCNKVYEPLYLQGQSGELAAKYRRQRDLASRVQATCSRRN